MDTAGRPEFLRRPPPPRLAGTAHGIAGYREAGGGAGALEQREAAALVVPIVLSLGTPFRIALAREPAAEDARPSFAAGLYAGPVHIASDGGAECVQLDLTPLGAYRVLGGAVAELAARKVDIGDVFGAAGRRLRERLGDTPGWEARFALVGAFVAARAVHEPAPEVAFAYRALAASGGTARVADLAREAGWSRKHLSARVHQQLGLPPKAIARMIRFHGARRLARAGAGRGGWAGIAAEAGYADQAHLAREFAALAGEPPTAWARRAAGLDARLRPPADG